MILKKVDILPKEHVTSEMFGKKKTEHWKNSECCYVSLCKVLQQDILGLIITGDFKEAAVAVNGPLVSSSACIKTSQLLGYIPVSKVRLRSMISYLN